MKGIAIVTAGLLALTAAANGEVVWLETSYDFGLMKEQAGPKQGFVRFVNRGPETVQVLEARPTCGCTDASCPEEPVAPGDTAVIRFTYDPTGRPGRFDKSIKVRFQDGKRMSVKIRGNVLGTPESLEQFYPVDAGALRLSDSKVMAGTMETGKTPSLFVNAYNTLNDSVAVAARCDEKAMKLKLSENRIGPGDVVTLAMYFDTRAYGNYGPVSVPVTIISAPGTPEERSCRVDFTGQVMPVRHAVSARELEKAPVCDPMPPVVDLGKIDSQPRPVELTVMNSGRSELRVLNVWSDSPAVKVKDFPARIKKGKGGAVRVEFNPAATVRSPFRIAVKVATDDPVNPLKEINLTGSIE